MEISMARIALTVSFVMGLASVITPAYSKSVLTAGQISGGHHDEKMKVQPIDPYNPPYDLTSSQPGSVTPTQGVTSSPRIFNATSYGADPTGQTDSTEALLQAMADTFRSPADNSMVEFVERGGAQLNLEGGIYRVSRPLQLPVTGNHNYMIHGGTLRATDDFPTDAFLVDLSAPDIEDQNSNDYITLRDLVLDANFRGGGIQVANSRRTTIANCYITGFTTTGIQVQSGHEITIRNSYVSHNAGGVAGDTTISWNAITLSSAKPFLVQSIITGRS